MASQLPAQHRALVLNRLGEDLELKTVPTPSLIPGSAIIKIEVAGLLSYLRDIYLTQDRHYSVPTPLTTGLSAIGRVAAVGPDAVALNVDQLVYVDCTIHGRDDPDSVFLTAIHEGMTEGSKKLMRDAWRDGVFAEYARMPLENCIPINETMLCQELGYSREDLMYICYLMVPFGGLRDIKLEPGETVVISPATGGYGGAGVTVAIAMGARVIAIGRNEAELARLKEHVLKGTPNASIETMKITGDEMADAATLKKFGIIDAVLDFTPPQAVKSPHVRSAVWALRRGGRVSLMGFNENPVTQTVTGRNITLKGKLMYERDDMLLFVKMLENGLFPRGEAFVNTKVFRLEDWKEALDAAAEHTGIGRYAVFKICD